MTIIELARRRGHKFICVTDEGEYEIDTDTAVIYNIKPGETMSRERFDEILLDSEITRAKSRALWLLESRDYPEKELRRKLAQIYSENAVDRVLDELRDGGVVDDMRYAENYAAELSSIRGCSRMAIKNKLREKGIPREIIDDVCDSLPEDECDMIIEVIRRKYANCFDDARAHRRMVDGLVRRGFGYDDIKRAIAKYNEDEGETDVL